MFKEMYNLFIALKARLDQFMLSYCEQGENLSSGHGHIICKEGVAVDADKVVVTVKWPKPFIVECYAVGHSPLMVTLHIGMKFYWVRNNQRSWKYR